MTFFFSLMPQSHLLYGEATATVVPRNREIPAVTAENLRWPQGRRTAYPYLLQAVRSPWDFNAEL